MFAAIFYWDYPPLHQSSAELVLCVHHRYLNTCFVLLSGKKNEKNEDIILIKQTNIRRRSDYIIGFITQAIGPNKPRKLTRLIAPAHNIVCEAMYVVFHSNFAA